MLDIKFIRENPEIVRNACAKKGFADNTNEILALDMRVRALKTETQKKTAYKNRLSEKIAAEKNNSIRKDLINTTLCRNIFFDVAAFLLSQILSFRH